MYKYFSDILKIISMNRVFACVVRMNKILFLSYRAYILFNPLD